MYRVTDDSGFLGIFDPHAYVSFVAENWTMDALVDHFKSEMYHYRLLLWGTGCEGTWRVEVRREASDVMGFREFVGSIVASEDLLCLSDYDSLALGAESEDVSLPQERDWDLYIPVTPGLYQCRIIQLRDHLDLSVVEDVEGPDFVIELLKTEQPYLPWSAIPGEHTLD